MDWDIDSVRDQFPALNTRVGGQTAVVFDGPGGTQVPKRVLDAVKDYLLYANANRGGPFLTSERTEDTITGAREAMACLLGASPEEIAFGANMTTLSFSLARALARGLEPGDEIIITDLDHEANRAPWLGLEEMGAKVHSVRFHPEGCTLDFEHLESLVTSRTRVAAIGAASNAVGTQTDLARVRKTLPEGCVLVVDGVHYTPHRPVDVREMDCDFFLCSAYKFFGPHVGVLYGRGEVFAKLATDRVRPQKNEIPDRIETGTLNHEGMAGTAAAVAFMADPESSGVPRTRDNILSSISRMGAYEDALFETLYRGLESIATVRIYGPPPDHARTPTAAFTLDGLDARTVAENLAKKGIFSWDGHFYAMTLVEKLDPGPGGLVRVGLAPYNTSEEVDRFLNSIEDMI